MDGRGVSVSGSIRASIAATASFSTFRRLGSMGQRIKALSSSAISWAVHDARADLLVTMIFKDR